MRTVVSIVLSSLLLLAGCHTHEVHVVGEPRPALPPQTPVNFYLDPQAPIRLYRALPRSVPPSELPPTARTVGRFRVLDGADRDTARELANEARRRGGDAVVIDSWKYGWVGRDDWGRDRHGFEMKGRLVRTR